MGAFTIGLVLAQTGAGEAALDDDAQAQGDDAYYDRWYEVAVGALARGLAPIRRGRSTRSHGSAT